MTPQPWHWVDCPYCGASAPHHRQTQPLRVDCPWCQGADIAEVPGTYQLQVHAEMRDRAKRLDLLVAIIRYHKPAWADHVLAVAGITKEPP